MIRSLRRCPGSTACSRIVTRPTQEVHPRVPGEQRSPRGRRATTASNTASSSNPATIRSEADDVALRVGEVREGQRFGDDGDGGDRPAARLVDAIEVRLWIVDLDVWGLARECLQLPAEEVGVEVAQSDRIAGGDLEPGDRATRRCSYSFPLQLLELLAVGLAAQMAPVSAEGALVGGPRHRLRLGRLLLVD